jgi:deoxyribonuclease V
LLDEVRAADRMAEVLLVDGSGILHHRRAGIAAHLGVVASLLTIGVTKKLLCGRVNIEGMSPGESRPVIHEQRPIGIALRPTAGSRRPIFVSPGHRVDLPFCEQLVRQLLARIAHRYGNL